MVPWETVVLCLVHAHVPMIMFLVNSVMSVEMATGGYLKDCHVYPVIAALMVLTVISVIR